jgi:hypothetical protein
MRSALILAGAAAVGLALAVPVPPVAADGLTQFHEMLRQAPQQVLSYKRGEARGDDGFVLEDVTIRPPADAAEGVTPEPIHIDRIDVEAFDFAAYRNGEPPNVMKLRAEGIAIDPKSFSDIDLRALTGRDGIKADFRLDYRADPERGTMTLNRLELELRDLARIELSALLDGVKPDGADAAVSPALRSARLVFEDRSLLGAALPNMARERGIEPDKIVETITATLDSLRPGQPAATLAVLDALAAFATDYKKPKGPLVVTVNPVRAMGLTELGEIDDIDKAMEVLVLQVSYAGARPAGDAKPTPPAR